MAVSAFTDNAPLVTPLFLADLQHLEGTKGERYFDQHYPPTQVPMMNTSFKEL